MQKNNVRVGLTSYYKIRIYKSHNKYWILAVIPLCTLIPQQDIPLWVAEDWEGQLIEECPNWWQYMQTLCVLLFCPFIPRDLALWGPENWEGQPLEECPVWWQYMQAPCLMLLRWTLPDTTGVALPLAGEQLRW